MQAVTTAMFGPLKPYLIETWPEIMLMIEAGTKNGEMRRGPRLISSACVSSIIGRPPMPEPMLQPMRTAIFVGQRVAGGQAAVLHRLDGGGEPEMDEAVHVAGFFLGDVVARCRSP